MGACCSRPARRASATPCRTRAMMIHQPLGGFEGQATDIEIHAKEILDARDRLNEILAKHTGQPLDKIEHDTERDNFMCAEEAKAYGIIDEVIEHR